MLQVKELLSSCWHSSKDQRGRYIDLRVKAFAARTVKDRSSYRLHKIHCRHGAWINCQCCTEPEGFVRRGNSTCSYYNKGRKDSQHSAWFRSFSTHSRKGELDCESDTCATCWRPQARQSSGVTHKDSCFIHWNYCRKCGQFQSAKYKNVMWQLKKCIEHLWNISSLYIYMYIYI